jgi:hypothetical protein
MREGRATASSADAGAGGMRDGLVAGAAAAAGAGTGAGARFAWAGGCGGVACAGASGAARLARGFASARASAPAESAAVMAFPFVLGGVEEEEARLVLE